MLRPLSHYFFWLKNTLLQHILCVFLYRRNVINIQGVAHSLKSIRATQVAVILSLDAFTRLAVRILAVAVPFFVLVDTPSTVATQDKSNDNCYLDNENDNHDNQKKNRKNNRPHGCFHNHLCFLPLLLLLHFYFL